MSEKSGDGFTLETTLLAYSFMPDADEELSLARELFVQVARHLSAEEDLKIHPVSRADILATATRNVLDGYYTVTTIGRIRYVVGADR